MKTFLKRLLLLGVLMVAVLLCWTLILSEFRFTINVRTNDIVIFNEEPKELINSKKEIKPETSSTSKAVLGTPVKSADSSKNETIAWTVLMTVNSAFFDFYKNWLWYYQQLHLPADIPVVVIAENEEMYKKLTTLNTPGITVKKSSMESINGSLVFNTPLFKKYMSRRAVYVLEYLEQGFDVLHVDVDSVWVKDPFPFLVGQFDVWGQEDKPGNVICIGFVAFRSSDAVIKLVKLWIDRMQDKSNNDADQDVFKKVLPSQKHIRVKKLPSDEFPSGKLYFDQFTNATRAKTVVVHNNWVIGHDTKMARFKKFNLWKV